MDYKKQMDIITACNCKIDLLYGELARRQGISYYTSLVLFSLQQAGACTQKEMAEAWMLPKQTVHTVVRELRDKGYVELHEGRNQKEKLVAFTPEGAQTAAEILGQMEQLEARILQRLGAAESCRLAEGIRRFAEIFEEELRRDEK